MKTKIKNNCIRLKCGLVLFFLYFSALGLQSPSISSSLKKIKELYTRGEYSIVLEKSLDILNTRKDQLTPHEAAGLHYYIGLAYKKNGNNEIAADYLKKITLKYPDSDYLKSVYRELADIFKNDYFQNETYLVKLFESFPNTPESVQAGIELSKGYLRLHNFKKALPIMETMVNLWNKGEENPELYILMAVGYSGIKDYLEAIDYLRRAEKTIKDTIDSNPHYLFEAGKIFHNNLNFKKAIDYLEPMFNVYPHHKDIPEAATILALCYERVNKLNLSAVFLIKAIEKRPPQKHIYDLFLNLGRILGKMDEQELKQIKRNYPLYSDAQKLLTLVKNNSLDFEQKRSAAILLSDEFKKANNMEKVVDNFYHFLEERRDPLVEKLFKQNLDQFLYELEKKEQHPEIFKVWVKLKHRKSYLSPEQLLRFGQAMLKLQLHANAQEIYLHLLKYQMYSEYWPTARKQLIRIYNQLGHHRECLQQLEQLNLDNKKEKSEFNYYRLFSYLHLEKDEEAEKLLDSDAVNINKITGIFQYRLALLKAQHLVKKNKHKEALDIYQRMIAFKQAPREDEGCLMVSLGNLYYKLRDRESALNYYRQAEKYNTNLEWTLFRIITLLKQLGKKSEVKKEMEKLKMINPASFWVRQLEKNVRW
ncbi:MAG: tetratricopeptide repeat protein [Candidatus Aminicenantes bacterium]|jgi:tetratricopeptide (TPR) repeat protein